MVLPSAEGSLRDTLTVTCFIYAQDLPTIVTLLPRVGLALALLLSFFSPENPIDELSLACRSEYCATPWNILDNNTGALSVYAKGVLIANTAWAAWRTLVRPA